MNTKQKDSLKIELTNESKIGKDGDFEFDWQIELWQKKEKEFIDEVNKRLKVK